MKISWFNCLSAYNPYIGNHEPAEPSEPAMGYYTLPYIEVGVNCWKSYTVEGLTIALMFLPVYGVLFPLTFLVQSLYMIPMHIYGFPRLVYRCAYSTLAMLDSVLP